MNVFEQLSESDAAQFMSAPYVVKQRSRRWLAARTSMGDTLDIGCGRGILVSELYRPHRYWGVDVSHALVEQARQDNPCYSFSTVQPGMRLPFKDREFEFVIIRSVLEHCVSLEEAQFTFMEARRVASTLVYVSWHTPPVYAKTELINVPVGDLGGAMLPQNHSARGSFDEDGLDMTVFHMDEATVWKVKK